MTIAELFNNTPATKGPITSTSINGVWVNNKALYLNYPALPEDEANELSNFILEVFQMIDNILADCSIKQGKLLSIQNINFTRKDQEYPEGLYLFTFSGLTQTQANRVNNEMDLALANDDYGFDKFTPVTNGDITTIIGTLS